jgi:hypothetical protein
VNSIRALWASAMRTRDVVQIACSAHLRRTPCCYPTSVAVALIALLAFVYVVNYNGLTYFPHDTPFWDQIGWIGHTFSFWQVSDKAPCGT